MRYFASAFKGTGKDELYKGFSGKRPLSELGWKVYSRDHDAFIVPIKPKRLALADELKLQVCERLQIPSALVETGLFDSLKEKAFVEGKSLRQHCIDLALEQKEKHGKMYFVDLIRDKISNAVEDVVLTDNRYPYEVVEGVLTIRLFRKEVPIPPKTDQSERSMDDYSPDYLFVKDEEDLRIIREMCPQFIDYHLIRIL
jgi:hypothetical protein